MLIRFFQGMATAESIPNSFLATAPSATNTDSFQEIINPEFNNELTAQNAEVSKDEPNPAIHDQDTTSDALNETSEQSKNFSKWKTARRRVGFSRLDKKLKIKRLNARLEKLLKPKNAFLVFNELNLKPEYTMQTIDNLPGQQKSYASILKLNEQIYTAVGMSASGAKMIAADLALKDWFLKSLIKKNCSEQKLGVDENAQDDDTKDEPFKWSVICSYAMYLLLIRWGLDVNAVESYLDQNKIVRIDNILGSVQAVPSNGFNVVTEPINYTPPENPKFPRNVDRNQPLHAFNLAFPNVPFIEQTNNSLNPDERFQLKCKISSVVFEAKARNKKDARKQIAIQVLNKFGYNYS